MAFAIGPSFLPLRLHPRGVFMRRPSARASEHQIEGSPNNEIANAKPPHRGCERMNVKSCGMHHEYVGVKRMHFVDDAVDVILKRQHAERVAVR
jgi:hypothetical protein